MGVVSASCTSSPNAGSKHEARATGTISIAPITSSSSLPTNTTTSNPCPPGCEYPSDHDAITVMASSASVVALVTVTRVPNPAGAFNGAVRVDTVLQGNRDGFGPYSARPDLTFITVEAGQTAVGDQYLVFASYDRGGTCVSALYAYDSDTEEATLLSFNDGYNDQVLLPGRTLIVPQTVSLDYVEARMNPTGGIVYPTDAGESLCPGP